MKAILSLLWYLLSSFGIILQLLRYSLGFCWALLLPKALLAARVLAAESQLAVELNRSGGSKRRGRQFTPAFRLLWVALSKVLDSWEDLVHLMKTETVKRWHTMASRLFWRSRPGRPPIPIETQQRPEIRPKSLLH